jgi:ABC-type multidrug transport system ATPase subunit
MVDLPLVAEGLGRRYRRKRPWALRDVSLSLPEGSITALVGPNGAGKSTLIRACIGFERPDAGRVLVAGIDPARRRAAAVKRVGYVPQAASLYPTLTIDDHFAMARVARPSFDRAYALERVALAGLSPDRPIRDLSGGEQAQVALALALGTRAPLLLLDEPLASLDPLARREFLTALVAHVREDGSTALLSSHIVTDVEQACDRIVVLSGGRVALDGKVIEVRHRYRTVPADRLDGRMPVAVFAGPAGESVALLDSDSAIGDPATLEDVVLGHLSAARSAAMGAR